MNKTQGHRWASDIYYYDASQLGLQQNKLDEESSGADEYMELDGFRLHVNSGKRDGKEGNVDV